MNARAAALVLTLLPATADAAHAQGDVPLGRASLAQPTLSPDGAEVAFVSGGDIWVAPGRGGVARLLVSHAADESRPLYSPDGGRLAFVSNRAGSDDLYVLDLAAGGVTRLTWSDGAEHLDAWSPDGRFLYFTDSSRESGGATDVFRVGVEGGTPLPVAADAYDAEYFAAAAPDGRTLALSGRARMAYGQWWRNGHSHIDEAEIWLVTLPDALATGGRTAAGGVPGAPIADAAAPTYRRLTEPGAKNLWAQWLPDGGAILFMSDRSGAENLWTQPLDGGAPAPLTRFEEGRVLWPSVAGGGGAVVFERDFGIWRMDLPGGTPEPLPLELRGAAQGPTTEHLTLTSGFEDLALSPDGKKIAFTARGDVFAAPAEEPGLAARVTKSVEDESEVTWAPDSRRLAYVSRRDGVPRIWIHDFATGREQPASAGRGEEITPRFSPDGLRLAYVRDGAELVVRELAGGGERVVARAQLWRAPFTAARPLEWSPDGRWLAFFATDARMFTHVHVVPSDGSGPARPVTRLANSFASALAWSPDGTSLFFDTQHRTEDGQIARVDLVPRTPVFRESRFSELFDTTATSTTGRRRDAAEAEEADAAEDVRVAIDFDGIFDRLSLLPLGVDAGPFTLSPNGETLVFVASAEGQTNLYAFSLDPLASEPAVARQLTSTTGGKGTPMFPPDGKQVLFLDRGRVAAVTLADARARTLDVSAELEVDWQRQKLAVFQQGWEYMRDHFYDEGMHGADWQGVRRAFAPQVAGARTRGELARLMNLMVGELNASHLGYGPPRGDGPRAETGRLGLRFDPLEQARTGRLVVSEVVPLSPADVAGEVGVGDVLLAVDGLEPGPGVPLERLLENTVGDRVELRLSRGGETRTAAVRPISTGGERQLGYRAWVAGRRAYVDSISGGRVGYVHMPDMGWDSYRRLVVDLDAQNFERDAVVIDLRNNNGGFVNAYALDVFARQGYLTMEIRGYPAVPARSMLGQRSLEAPTVLVVNQNSLSDAEDFTEGYRTLRLGPVVGEPTAGWIIYTWGASLVDGGSFRMPRSRIRAADGEVMELNPRPVDIRVESELGEGYRGVDRQLDAAVAAVLEGVRP